MPLSQTAPRACCRGRGEEVETPVHVRSWRETSCTSGYKLRAELCVVQCFRIVVVFTCDTSVLPCTSQLPQSPRIGNDKSVVGIDVRLVNYPTFAITDIEKSGNCTCPVALRTRKMIRVTTICAKASTPDDGNLCQDGWVSMSSIPHSSCDTQRQPKSMIGKWHVAHAFALD